MCSIVSNYIVVKFLQQSIVKIKKGIMAINGFMHPKPSLYVCLLLHDEEEGAVSADAVRVEACREGGGVVVLLPR